MKKYKEYKTLSLYSREIKETDDKYNVLNYWLRSWIKNQGLYMTLLRNLLILFSPCWNNFKKSTIAKIAKLCYFNFKYHGTFRTLVRKGGTLEIQMEMCRCVGMTQRTPNFKPLQSSWQISNLFFSVWGGCPCLIQLPTASVLSFHCSLWNLPCQELTLLQKALKSEDLKYDIGAGLAYKESGNHHSILTVSKKLNNLIN